MARGRMINATIAEDEAFNSMSIDAQFLFMRTLPHLDRDGLITGNVALLWSKIAPLLSEYNTKMTDIIQEWIANGFVMNYRDGKQEVLFFVSFRKNQFGMRYEKEGASRFAPPPGYQRTESGLTPVVPPSSNGGDTESGRQTENVGTDKGRTKDVQTPLEENRREIEGEDNAHASDKPEVPHFPPPISVIPPEQAEEQPDMRQPLPGEYLPGLPQPKMSKLATIVTQAVADAKKLGIDAKQFRLMVDAFLDGCASKPLADAGGERGEQTLLYAQEQTLTLCRMDARFRSVGGIESVFASWRENDYRGDTVPNSKQVLEHASKMACDKVVNERMRGQVQPQKPPTKSPEPVNFSMGKLFNERHS